MRKLRFRDISSEATFDLNLAPMLDMFVSIIPFMLLAATFLQLMLINAPLPAPVAQALQQDRENKDKDFVIRIEMQGSKQFIIDTQTSGGQKSRVAISKTAAGDYDYSGLHKRLVEYKQKYPKLFKLELNPTEDVDYKSIVAVMDAARNMESQDPKILIDNAETPLLFPDVILSNVMTE